nr:hypothetical protein [Amycolatopsis rubida]
MRDPRRQGACQHRAHPAGTGGNYERVEHAAPLAGLKAVVGATHATAQFVFAAQPVMQRPQLIAAPRGPDPTTVP